MTITESRRFDLHRALRNEFGVAVADTLMEHLPPTGWGDVARQSDVFALRTDFDRLRSDFDGLRSEMGTMREGIVNEINVTVTEKLNSQLRWMIGLFAAQFIALASIALR